MTKTQVFFSAVVWGLLGVGCGASTGPATSGTPAFARDLVDFEQWEPFVLPDASATVDAGSPHGLGERTVFLKTRPPQGSTEFPVGTVIVKKSSFSTFAMHKRGGSYNANGARGWEWLELQKTGSGQIVIVWQGLGPPAGEKYGDIDVTCNDCHKGAVENDSVLSEPLQLGNLTRR